MAVDLIERAPIIRVGPTSRAIVFAEYFPPYMGSDRRIFDLARNSSRWAFEFCVIPPLRILGGRCEEALEEYFQRHFIDGVVDDESGGIHGHYFTLPRALMWAWRRLGLPVAYALSVPYLSLQCAAFLRRLRPDAVVVAHPSYLCGAVGLIASRLAGIPVLLDYPDAWTPLAVETANISPSGVTARVLRLLESVMARSASEITSITEGLSRYIRSLGSKAEIRIVANGADDEVFRRDDPPIAATFNDLENGCDVVLYSGRLEAWSGVHEIAETIERVCTIRPKTHFMFVGDGSAAEQLQAEIEERGLSPKATFLGFQRFSRMPNIIARADIAIVPFPDTATTRVCVPVKLFEYMLMEKPIITTDLPGIRESVTEQEVAFIPNMDASELSRAILGLLEDRAHALALAKSGYELAVKKFTWKRLVPQFEDAISRMSRYAKV